MGVGEDPGGCARLGAELALREGMIFSPPGVEQATRLTKTSKHDRMFARIE